MASIVKRQIEQAVQQAYKDAHGEELEPSDLAICNEIVELELKVRELIKKLGCGDYICDLCKNGISIGIPSLDSAYNLGYRHGDKS